VALIDSIVVRVTVFPWRETVCTKVAASAKLISSLRSRAVVGSGPRSGLTTRRRSLAVRPFFSWGLLLVVGLAGVLAALEAIVVFSFLPFLATEAQDLCGAAVRRAIGRELAAADRSGAVTGSGKSIGVGVSGLGVAFLSVLTSTVRALIWSRCASMAVL